jgi:CDP-glycerol glycerophosphotransferase (TagB/SpsB family)
LVFSYYLIKYPYKWIWAIKNRSAPFPKVVVYISHPLDYIVLKPVLKYMPDLPMVVKNYKTARFLLGRGMRQIERLSFPKAVIMCRHSAHRFPEEKILKFGFRHGAYHFKSLAGTQYYNAFDVYFVTSRQDMRVAEQRGVRSALAIGFPKIDPAFDGTWNTHTLESYRIKAGLDASKQTLIFTCTWNGSGMSAIEFWVHQLSDLSRKYNILVTVHPWTSKRYIHQLIRLEHVYFIHEPDTLPYLMIADLLVGDTSSIIAEFCALNKPMVTFNVTSGKRRLPEISQLLSKISMQISKGNDLAAAIKECLRHPDEKRSDREKANRLMFDQLDGLAGKRGADVIQSMLARL